jgi:hypothetical protein
VNRLTVGDLSPLACSAVKVRDRLGRRDPYRLLVGLPGIRHVASWGVRIREVPAAYWSLDGTTAVIACMCGQTPGAVALESLTECDCGRYFFFDGEIVWALGAPDPEASDKSPESPA